jgi:hypothetical protein
MYPSKRVLIPFLSLWITSAQAALSITEIVIWQCDAQDIEKSFSSLGTTESSSMSNAMKLCKKTSKNPKTCDVSREYCDALVNGQSIRPWWQCKAMDTLGYTWIGSYYRVADNAILNAKSRCYSFSAIPLTCYTSFFTCKKLNP